MRCSSGIVLFYICNLIPLIFSLQITRPIQLNSQWSNKHPTSGSYQYQDPRNYDPNQGYRNYEGSSIETRSWNYQNDPTSQDQNGLISSSMSVTTEIPDIEQSIDEFPETESTSIESPLLDMEPELDESSNEVQPYYYPVPYYYQSDPNGQYYSSSSGFNGQVPGPNNGQGQGFGSSIGGQGSGSSSGGQGFGSNPGQGPGSFQGQGNGPIRGQGQGLFQNTGNGNGQGPNQGQRRPPATTPQPEEEPTTTETPTTTLAPFTLADVKVPTPFLRIELMTCFTILGAIYGFGFMVLFQSLCVPAAKIAIAVVYIVLLKLKAIQPVSLAAALEQLPPT